MAFPNVATLLDSFNAGASQGVQARAGWTSGSGGLFQASSTSMSTDAVPTKAGCSPSSFSSNSWAGVSSADAEVFVVMANNCVAGGSVDIYCRITGLGATLAAYSLEVAGTNAWEIDKTVAGVGTSLLGGVTQAVVAGDSVGFEVIGTTLTGYYKSGAGAWVQKIQTTDSSITGAGLIGVSCNNVGTFFDSFNGGALGAAPATKRPKQIVVPRTWARA